MVSSALTAPLIGVIPDQYITPMSVMMAAYDVFLEDNTGIAGEVMEVSVDQWHFRKPAPFLDEQQRWMAEDSAELFAKAFGQA